MEYLLLVTWFVGSNAASSYQVGFATRQACDTALSDLKNDARRIGASPDTMKTPPRAPAVSTDARSPDSSLAPVLSAICVNLR